MRMCTEKREKTTATGKTNTKSGKWRWRTRTTNKCCQREAVLAFLRFYYLFILCWTLFISENMIIRQWRSSEWKSCMLHEKQINHTESWTDFCFILRSISQPLHYLPSTLAFAIRRLLFSFLRRSLELIYVKRIDLDTFFIIALQLGFGRVCNFGRYPKSWSRFETRGAWHIFFRFRNKIHR